MVELHPDAVTLFAHRLLVRALGDTLDKASLVPGVDEVPGVEPGEVTKQGRRVHAIDGIGAQLDRLTG